MKKILVFGGIWVALAITAQIGRMLWLQREQRLGMLEARLAQHKANSIHIQLKQYYKTNGALPGTLDQAGLAKETFHQFRYSTNSEGYSFGYFGQRYSTAAKRWSGNFSD